MTLTDKRIPSSAVAPLARMAVSILLTMSSTNTLVAAVEPCTMCFGGTDYDPTGKIGTTSCKFFAGVIGATDSQDTTCTDTQIQTYQFCSCETYPTDDYCSMCDDGSFDIPSRNRVIDGLGGMTCGEALFVKSHGNADMCVQIREAAYFCGCPSALEPPSACTFCPTKGTTVAFPDRTVPPYYNKTCGDVEAAVTNTPPDQCVSSATVTGTDGNGVDLRSYCGCPDTEPAQICDLCSTAGDGFELVADPGAVLVRYVSTSSTAGKTNDGDMAEAAQVTAEITEFTCLDANVTAQYITSDNYCTSLHIAATSTCCIQPNAPSVSTTATISDGGDAEGSTVATNPSNTEADPSAVASPPSDSINADESTAFTHSMHIFTNLSVVAGTVLWALFLL